MSNPIKQVSTTDVPGQYSDETQSGYKPLPPAVKDSTYFDARVPANIIDRIRRDARERQYGNSTLEAEAILATDEQVFEKVRVAEQHSIQRADAMLNQGKGRVGDALSYLDQIDALRARLKAGEDTQTIAKEFDALERQVRSREVSVLHSMATEAEVIEAALADPVAHAQRLYSLMPLAFGRAAGLVPTR
jgi:hypothetical protein